MVHHPQVPLIPFPPERGKKKKKDKNLEQKVSQNQKSDFVLVAMDRPMYHLS